jgi:sterol desaturase/sphingolipid hydroxylase (fatty acid hydroxylase superfamily)
MDRFFAVLLAHEPAVRLGCFLGIFALVAAAELIAPRREPAHSRRTRWPGNLGIVALNGVVVRLLLPVTAVALAAKAADAGWGLLNATALPAWLEILIAVIVLDFVIYLQHVVFHAVPALWHLHRMHHADLDYDVTTGARFHPVEIALSAVIKLGTVAALGPAPAAVLVFEILLNGTAMFNHGNVRLPARVDRVLRRIVVTPDMHRVHHSIVPRETNSNFGFNLPWWDRLFGTYRAQPEAGHERMEIGIPQFREPRDLRLDRMLVQPFMADDNARPPAPGGGTA